MNNHKVLKKQFNSKLCLVCGMENELGLKARFYELEDNQLAAIFTVLEKHQSFPGRLHGGMASAILDETIGRALTALEPDSWAVTVELDVKYKKPIPLDTKLLCIGRVTRNTRLVFEGEGEIFLPDGEIAVTAHAKYRKFPLDKITGDAHSSDNWIVWLDPEDDDPKEIFF